VEKSEREERNTESNGRIFNPAKSRVIQRKNNQEKNWSKKRGETVKKKFSRCKKTEKEGHRNQVHRMRVPQGKRKNQEWWPEKKKSKEMALRGERSCLQGGGTTWEEPAMKLKEKAKIEIILTP